MEVNDGDRIEMSVEVKGRFVVCVTFLYINPYTSVISLYINLYFIGYLIIFTLIKVWK